MKPVTIVQHEPDDPPGSIAVALHDLGVPFAVCRLDQGDALPSWPHETSGLISLGGAMHVTQTKDHPFLADEIKLMRRVVHEGGPVWGICLGAQLLTLAAGAKHLHTVAAPRHQVGRRRQGVGHAVPPRDRRGDGAALGAGRGRGEQAPRR